MNERPIGSTRWKNLYLFLFTFNSLYFFARGAAAFVHQALPGFFPAVLTRVMLGRTDLSLEVYETIVDIVILLIFFAWIYKYQKDCLRLLPRFTLSPGKALIRFLLPLYNFYGVINYHYRLRRHTAEYPSVGRPGATAFYLAIAWVIMIILSIAYGAIVLLVKLPIDPVSSSVIGMAYSVLSLTLVFWRIIVMHRILVIRSAEEKDPGAQAFSASPEVRPE